MTSSRRSALTPGSRSPRCRGSARRWTKSLKRSARDRLPTPPIPMSSSTPPMPKGRVNNRVVSRAVVVAMGVTKEGNREILGLSIGDLRGQGLLDRVPPEPPGSGAHRRRARHF